MNILNNFSINYWCLTQRQQVKKNLNHDSGYAIENDKGWECYGIKSKMDVKFDISETLLFEKNETCKVLDAFSLLLLISRLFSSLRSTVNWNSFMQCISYV